MYCANCGTEHEADAKFCRSCGQTFAPEGGDLALAPGGRLGNVLQGYIPADLTHERIGAILSQAVGLFTVLLAVLAIAQKPSPGVFMLYAVPVLIGGVVTILERRSSVGKAVLLLIMLAPYFSLFLVGVPPIFTSGLQDLNATAAGLSGYMTFIGFASFFLLLGFLLLVLTPIASLILQRQPAIAGLSALAASLVFTVLVTILLGTPSGAVRASVAIADQLDKSVQIHTTAALPKQDGTLEETAAFKSNELIYPYAEGVTGGTSIGFRLVDANGKAVVAFNRGDTIRAKGSGLEKAAALNTATNRVEPGSYTLELLAAQGWKTAVLARTEVTISGDVNPNYGNDEDSAFAWIANNSGVAATSFAPTEEIHLVLDGSRVQDGVTLLVRDSANKIVVDKEYTAMPLGKSDYVLAAKASDLGSGQFVASLTTNGKDAITIYFTVS